MKQVLLTLDNEGIQKLESLINQMPIGNANVQTAFNVSNHVQEIMKFLGENISEIQEEAKPKKDK
jgi:hypothetical protein